MASTKLFIPPNVANKLSFTDLNRMVAEIAENSIESLRVEDFIFDMQEKKRYTYPQANEIIRLYNNYVLAFVHPGEPSESWKAKRREANKEREGESSWP